MAFSDFYGLHLVTGCLDINLTVECFLFIIRNTWLVDDSRLTLTLCEDTLAYDDEDSDPAPVYSACCAGEAEYSLMFQVIFTQQ